jgi:hypothetical protein
MTDQTNNDSKPEEIIHAAGSHIAEATIGAVLSTIIQGPLATIFGAAGGAAITTAIKIALDFARRPLTHTQEARLATFFSQTVRKIQENLESGRELRSDNFFHGQPGKRSIAEEIAEGIFTAARNTHEDNKVPFLANLNANLAFDQDIDLSFANYLVRQADNMSYRQICLLALFMRRNDFDIPRQAIGDIPRQDLLRDVIDLHARFHDDMYYDLINEPLEHVEAKGTDIKLYHLMELWRIDKNDLHIIVRNLRQDGQVIDI